MSVKREDVLKYLEEANMIEISELVKDIEDKLGVPKKRIYIEFADAKGSMWGWNGRTF